MGVFNEKETLANFRKNLWADRLFRSFAKHPPETYQEAYNRALEQVDIEEKLRIEIEHNEAQLAPRHKNEAPKLAPAGSSRISLRTGLPTDRLLFLHTKKGTQLGDHLPESSP